MRLTLRNLVWLAAALVTVSAHAAYIYSTSNAFPPLTFAFPVCMATPPGETNRLFVLEKGGTVMMVTNLGNNPSSSVFMKVKSLVTDSECGLLGMDFHPGYATNGYFYLYYTPGNIYGQLFDRLSRFSTDPANPTQGLVASEVKIINQLDPAENHNAGDIHFGPDGYLYLSLGDGGGGNDQFHNSQRIDKNFFSGIIRIDVDKLPGNLTPNPSPYSSTNYLVPSDNPFIGATQFNGLSVNTTNVRTEYWAVGLRNPWRFTFDSASGLLYCADVGQSTREEIDIITKGGNYGWNYREGNIARPGSASPPAGFVGINPIYDYPHVATKGDVAYGEAVLGGVVYHGSGVPPLDGAYIFGDYDGTIWEMNYDTNAGVVTNISRLTSAYAPTAFGIDPSTGDVLIASQGDGQIRRLIGTPDTIPPVVRIDSPVNNSFKATNKIVVIGTSRDNLAVASVSYQLNDAAFQPATGTNPWTANITLVPGTNVFTAQAVDTSGNVSTNVTNNIFYGVRGTLSLHVTGKGTATSNLYGGVPYIGRNYKVTAVPAKGYVFSNWTDGSGNILGTSTVLTFLMQSSVTINANFIP